MRWMAQLYDANRSFSSTDGSGPGAGFLKDTFTHILERRPLQELFSAGHRSLTTLTRLATIIVFSDGGIGCV